MVLALLRPSKHNLNITFTPYLGHTVGDIPKTKFKEQMHITETSNDSLSEAFRLLRTNIGFLLGSTQRSGQVILLTSTIGGEGKTFVTINLASVLSSLNKNWL